MILKPDKIQEIHKLAITLGLHNKRKQMLYGVNVEYVASMPEVGNPSDQLLTDLYALNESGLIGGATPLERWLRNAAHAARPNQEREKTFRDWADRVAAEMLVNPVAKSASAERNSVSSISPHVHPRVSSAPQGETVDGKVASSPEFGPGSTLAQRAGDSPGTNSVRAPSQTFDAAYLKIQALQHTLHLANKKDPPKFVLDDGGTAFNNLLTAALDLSQPTALPETHHTSPFSYLTDVLCRSPRRHTIWLRGSPGSGRSTLTQAAWKYIARQRAGGTEVRVPFFFALNSHELKCAERLLEAPLEECVHDLLTHEIESINAFLSAFPQSKPVFIFDGFDQRNIFRRFFIRHYIKRLIRADDATILLSIEDEMTKWRGPHSEDLLLLQNIGLDAPHTIFQLRSAHLNTPRAGRLIAAYEAAVPLEEPSGRKLDLRTKLLSLDLSHIDIFLLSVVRNQITSPTFRNAANYSEFFSILFRTRLVQAIRGSSTTDSVDQPDLINRLESAACAAAFAATTTREPPKFADVNILGDAGGAGTLAAVAEWCKVDRDKLSRHHVVSAFAAFSTVRLHELMQNVLAARHVYKGFISIGPMKARKEVPKASMEFDFVFPAVVNRSFRHLIAGSQSEERSAFKGAKVVAVDPNCPFNARAHAVYLLGRMNSAALRGQALTELRKLAQADTSAGAVPGASGTPVETRTARLFRRGLFISLAYLGDLKASEQYVELLLRDAEENKLNRGFHLEYYGDLEYTPVSGLAHEDPEDDRFRKTFHELNRRLTGKVGALTGATATVPAAISARTPIEVATIASIIQTRHGRKLLDPRLLVLARKLLDQLLRLDLAEPPGLRAYVATVRRNLECEDFAAADILGYWYRLKNEVRAGWIDRKERGLFTGAGRIESVAEHVLFTYYMALIYLPAWNTSLGDKYDKGRVLSMLLVHDLAEAFTGDHVPGDGHEESRELEWFNYMRGLDTYSDIHDTRDIHSLYEEFYHLSSLEARIAKDMDRLENLVQLYRYRAFVQEGEFLAWEEDLVNKIATRPGRHVLRVIQVNRDRSPALTREFMSLPNFS